MTWEDLPNTPSKHGWAFYYWLIKQGERVTIVSQNGRSGPLTLYVHTVDQLEQIDC